MLRNQKKTIITSFLLASILFSLVGCGGGGISGGGPSGSSHVTITNNGSHYEVVLNYDNISHYNIGAEYGEKILQVFPYPQWLDSYIAMKLDNAHYETFLTNVGKIKPQIDQDYRDEIHGLASKLCAATDNVKGDGKLSIDELYLLNLYADAVRQTQCAALAVFGPLSATGSAMVGRILDMGFPEIQAVTTFRNGGQSICTIGYLGFMGVISGFNRNKIFAAILDSPTNQEYSAAGKHSYPFDLRHALENLTTIDGVANYMESPPYAFPHLIFLADPTSGKVLENNTTTGFRQARTAASALGAAMTWGFPNAIGCVNSFLLAGNTNNTTTETYNTARWNSLKTELSAKGDTVTLDELKEIVSYDGADGGPMGGEDGDLYNVSTQQIILFEPDTLNLQVFFHPKDSDLPSDPNFEDISVSF